MAETELFRRYVKACALEQSVDPARVEEALKAFFAGLGVKVTVREVGSFKAAWAASCEAAFLLVPEPWP